ncbi:hypothetical protein GCM10020255_070330 [Rhodococcus baikonurensis]
MSPVVVAPAMGQHGDMTTTPPTAAVILAGGRGTRMGGVDKPGLIVHGRRLLDIALSATAHLDAVVVVGPHRPELAAHITQTQESPAGAALSRRSGPGWPRPGYPRTPWWWCWHPTCRTSRPDRSTR